MKGRLAMQQQNRFNTLALRLWPGLADLDPRQQILAYGLMRIIAITTPLALLALIWLIAATEPDVFADHGLVLVLAGAALAFIEQRKFSIYMELATGDLVPTTSTLSNLVYFGAALIFGPTALWLMVVASVLSLRYLFRPRAWTWQVFWSHVSTMTQALGISMLGSLIGLAVYTGLGGEYPLAGLDVGDWLPALVAVLVDELFGIGLALVLLYQFNRTAGVERPLHSLINWLKTIIVLATPGAPFAVLAALIYSEAGRGLFLAFVAGITLVNFLAYHLSRTVELSLQRARELAQLEALGEALIQAPPDLSTLRDLLDAYLNRMFPQDWAVVRLFDAAESGSDTSPALYLANDSSLPPVEDSIWDHLRAAEETYIHLPHTPLPGVRGSRGAAVVCKILADDPGQEGGEKEQFLGGVFLRRARTQGKPTTSLAAIQSLASQIGSAHYRARVHRDTLATQRMAQELEFAGEVQARFLPRHVPQIPGWDIAAGLTPARQTTGDFYDFVPFEDGRIGLLVADVADKGTGAALYMALSRTLIRTFALQHPDAPEEALRLANARLLTDADSDQFVTVFYGVLDPATGRLVYANAGHNPAYVLANGAIRARDPVALTKTGLPLGMFDDFSWQQGAITLEPGNLLVAYTDGISEAQDRDDAEFGEDRLLAAVTARRDDLAAGIHAGVIAAVRDFVGDAPQFDDLTLMIVRRG
ncbi:MAG: PP2C family protein-serine/threonine phosphatase [Anaerolineae bacterium]|nr:PP2C family protein-serine/threonine phosphatase [Anaerolineae bacterium]